MTEELERVSPLQEAVTQRLVRAWLSIGIGGLMMFFATAFIAGSLHIATATLVIGVIGATLALRGSSVVKQTRRELLMAAAQRALPPARIV